MEWVFFISVALVFYSYCAYPVLLALFAKIFGHSTSIRGELALPRVAVVIAAFNEEQHIKARIENLLACDYPNELLDIYIGSDGSSDSTGEIIESFKHAQFHGFCYTPNRGKASTLNQLLTEVEQEVVVFSDANTEFEKDAIRQLVQHFDDPDIGLVSGELKLVSAGDHSNKDGVYWRYEQFLKQKESCLDAMIGANGAIYAIRKSSYQAIDANTIVDDFMIAMNVAKSGMRVIYERGAIAYEEVAPSLAAESSRRVRIGTGNYQAFMRSLWALNPLMGWRSFAFVGHKVLRWFTPHFMILALLSSASLSASPAFAIAFTLQVLVYIWACWGIRQSAKGVKLDTTSAFISFFVSMNWAFLHGFYRYCFTNVQGTWQRTARQ